MTSDVNKNSVDNCALNVSNDDLPAFVITMVRVVVLDKCTGEIVRAGNAIVAPASRTCIRQISEADGRVHGSLACSHHRSSVDG